MRGDYTRVDLDDGHFPHEEDVEDFNPAPDRLAARARAAVSPSARGTRSGGRCPRTPIPR